MIRKMERIVIKNWMIVLLLSITIGCTSIKSQILPLNTFIENIPTGAHLKDLNNDLDNFVGIYQATYKGNTVTITLTKVSDLPKKVFDLQYFTDGLIMTYNVKNFSGQTIQTNGINHLNEVKFSGFDKILNRVSFIYSGTYCSSGNGIIYLKYKNPQQLGWVLKDGTDGSSNCPPGSDETVYLPEWDEIIFTRQ